MIKNEQQIALALIDSLYITMIKGNNIFDLESFEIQLVKHGLELTEDIKLFFESFIEKNKSSELIESISKLLSLGIHRKYHHYNERLENLKSLYEIIIWIETHTEYTALKYLDDMFTENKKQFYKFILFYTLKKDSIEQIEAFEDESIAIFMNDYKAQDNNFHIMELIFRYFKNIQLIIKVFLEISKDRDYYKFIIVSERLASNQSIEDILKGQDSEEYLHFILYLIAFNPYITIDDFKINIFKKNTKAFYLFIQALLYRFDYYDMNQKFPNSLPLILKYILKDTELTDIKTLIYKVKHGSVQVLEPLVKYLLSYKNEEINVLILLKIIKLESHADNFMTTYNLLNSIIANIEDTEKSTNILIGNFKHYLTQEKEFNASEIKNFFVFINLYLTYKDLKPAIKEKLFKMNLKLYEKRIKDSLDLNPFLLSLSKYYHLILNKFLKEYHNSSKEINTYTDELRTIITSNKQLLPVVSKSLNDIDPSDELSLASFIDQHIIQDLTEAFYKTRNKITIYATKETKAMLMSKASFYSLIILKVLILYDLFYPLVNKMLGYPVKVKKEKEKIFLMTSNDVLQKELDRPVAILEKKKFPFHLINKIYSTVFIIIASLLGFRFFIDGLIATNYKLIFAGIGILFTSFLLDFLLYFIVKKIEQLHFFKLKYHQSTFYFYSQNEDLLDIFRQ